jgi:signal transduction histidine kinase
MYMDSFVATYVQELATRDAFTNEARAKLETLLSPASTLRPIVAFRIWKGDTVAFSNESGLIGKTFSRSKARQRALDGHIGVDFELPDGDDDEQVRALRLPILEVYAPVREKGTGRIIALAETYEIAIGLASDVWINQVIIWGSVAAIALALIALLFSMTGIGRIERDLLIAEVRKLSRLWTDAEERRRKIARANMKISEKNEQYLRRVHADLQHGPVQNVTQALLKLDPILWTDQDKGSSASPNAHCAADIDCVRKILVDAIRQIRDACSATIPARVDDLAVREALASAAREHHRLSGAAIEYDFANVPEQLPTALKTCLYRIAIEGLRGTCGGSRSQTIRAELGGTTIAIEIVGGPDDKDSGSQLVSLRDRVEALGGTLSVGSTPSGRLVLSAELDVAEMGVSVA